MAQSSAGAGTKVIPAGGMDTSISKKKRKRNKKDRGLADLSAVNASTSGSSIKPSNVASTSHSPNHAALADRAKAPASLPTALPPHLVTSKKRKRAATPPSEISSDTGHLPKSLVSFQADTSSKSQKNARKRRKQEQETPSLARNTKDASSVQDTSLHISTKPVEKIQPSPLTTVDMPSRRETSSTAAVLAAAPEIAPGNGSAPAAKLAARQNEMQQSSNREQQPSHEASSVHPANDSTANVSNKDKKRKRKAKRQQALKLSEPDSASTSPPLLPARTTSSDTANTALPRQDQPSVASDSAAISNPVTAASFTAGRVASSNASTSAFTPDLQAIPDIENRVAKVHTPILGTSIQAGSKKPKQSRKAKKRTSVSKELTQTTSGNSPERIEKNNNTQTAVIPTPKNHTSEGLLNEKQLNARTSPSRFHHNTQKSSHYSGGEKSFPSWLASETVPSSAASISGFGLPTQSNTSSDAVRAPPTQPSNTQASQAEVPSSPLSPRILLYDEESDTDLYHFCMREYNDDDTNHTDDEGAGFYLPEPTDLHSSRRWDSSLLSARSTPTVPSSIMSTDVAWTGHQPRVTSPVKKTTLTATGSPSASTESDKSMSANRKIAASSSKSGKRVIYTTPSRIMQNFVQGNAKATSGERLQVSNSEKASQAKPSVYEDYIGTSDTLDATAGANATAPVASCSGSTINEFGGLATAQTSNAGLGSALVGSKVQVASKSSVASLRRPVVEITVRRTGSSVSPRKSPVKAPRQSFPAQPITGTSVALSSTVVDGSPSPHIARLPTRPSYASYSSLHLNLSVNRPDATSGPSNASANAQKSPPYAVITHIPSEASVSPLNADADLAKSPSGKIPASQGDDGHSQRQQAEDSAKLASPPSPPSPASPPSSPPAVTDAMSIDEKDAPPAEQATSSTLLGQEVRAEPRIFRFLEEIQSEDSDGDSEDSSSSDTEDDHDGTGVPVKRRWPVNRARNESSSPEPASDEDDEDSDTGPEPTGSTPAVITKVRYLSPPVVQDAISKGASPGPPVKASGVTNDEIRNESQILLETIAQMATSGEAQSKSLPEEDGSMAIEKGTSMVSTYLPVISSVPIVKAQVSTNSSPGGFPASTRFQSGPRQPTEEDESRPSVLEPGQDSVASPVMPPEEAVGAYSSVDNDTFEKPESALGLTFASENTMSSEPFLTQTLRAELPSQEVTQSSPPFLTAYTSAPTNVNIDHAEPPAEVAPTSPADDAPIIAAPDYINSPSIPSPSRNARKLYPCLSALDSEMSQPMFAALGSQDSPNVSDGSQMDELEQTQLLPEYANSEKVRFTDFGPTPSPLQTGFDTASQIDELMQSSFEERSIIAAERRELDARNGPQDSDEESQSSRDNQSGGLPSSELPHQSLQDSTNAASDDARMTSESDVEAPTAPSAVDAIVPQPGDATAIGTPGDGEIALQPHKEDATASMDSLKAGSHASPELLSEPSSPTSSDVGQSTKSQLQGVSDGQSQTLRQMSTDSGSVGAQTRSIVPRKILPAAIAAMAIPSVLPRINSISAISNRFQGKLAERRNSGPIPRVNLVAKATQQPPIQSADSSDESDDEEDSDSDSRVTPEQNSASKQRLVGLAALQ